MARNSIDKMFDLCLLLVTVIGAAELQYASFIFSFSPTDPSLTAQGLQNAIHSNILMTNSIFRWTTFTPFILITVWIFANIIPSTSNLSLQKIFKRRIAKEFCWSLFGNLFLMEIIYFFSLSFSAGSQFSSINLATGTTLAFVIYSSFFLTFYATWKYRKDDIYEMQNLTFWRSVIASIPEHLIIFALTNLLMIVIWGLSIVVPTP
jgi:hypothetical protein